AVERAPGAVPYVRETRRTSLAVTNHFEGPLAIDPKNLRVRRTSTTLARRARVDDLLSRIAPRSATPLSVLGILRDHGCAGDPACKLGDRRAIDALIATHGIVADLTAGVLWVSAGPHLSGKFVRFDLRTLLAPHHDPASDGEPEALPEDPILHDLGRSQGTAVAGIASGTAQQGRP
ncbi:MAG: C45 family autoproteolytic acyltransferase/hydrolase, partial [Polyangiaceae bacterium]